MDSSADAVRRSRRTHPRHADTAAAGAAARAARLRPLAAAVRDATARRERLAARLAQRVEGWEADLDRRIATLRADLDAKIAAETAAFAEHWKLDGPCHTALLDLLAVATLAEAAALLGVSEYQIRQWRAAALAAQQ